jgi:hypothetical protein
LHLSIHFVLSFIRSFYFIRSFVRSFYSFTCSFYLYLFVLGPLSMGFEVHLSQVTFYITFLTIFLSFSLFSLSILYLLMCVICIFIHPFICLHLRDNF